MKVTNNKIGPAAGKLDSKALDTAKTGKSEASKGLLQNTPAGDAQAAKGTNNVNVSERAQMMQKAKEIATKHTPSDDAKIARLQKLIDEGKYKTDAAAIADKLVDEHMTIPD